MPCFHRDIKIRKYKKNDLDKILRISKQKKLNILTTEKDYYRLPDSFKKHVEFIKINVNIENEDLFKNIKNYFLENKCIKYVYQMPWYWKIFLTHPQR